MPEGASVVPYPSVVKVLPPDNRACGHKPDPGNRWPPPEIAALMLMDQAQNQQWHRYQQPDDREPEKQQTERLRPNGNVGHGRGCGIRGPQI
jgi:hypothetical protein